MVATLWREFESGDGAAVRVLRGAVVATGCGFLCVAVFLPMDWGAQAVVALSTLAMAWWMHRIWRTRLVTLAIVLLSVFSTMRYAVWRVRSAGEFLRGPGDHVSPWDAVFVLALLLAEGYAFAVLLLGYMQTAWPLRRPPVSLPDDADEWPAVDVLIPTLNEPLELVRATALAAMNIDWPVEKLKVWVLDDGHRDEFREFAEQAGIGYLARGESAGAKAGNINYALDRTSAPFVAVFDCDHAPTRSFLQVTMGWLLRDAKLALVQTPHRFYSQNPFERNVAGADAAPGEEQLFHSVIQDGNDLWNAAALCGSCAVLRRSALNEIGGMATESVTEDVQTSLRLQKRGWGTACVNIPQAAGLATETLRAHVRQRVRWARGMMQTAREERPLSAAGLRWPQRLCYLNEAAYFLSALPRLVFLTAPAVYLIFGTTVLPGVWAAIVAYALPHLLLAALAHARMYGRKRSAFWNEIYETAMAPHILLPTLAALLRRRGARFQVTEKGGVVEREFYDLRTAAPHLALLALNLAALLFAAIRLAPAGALAGVHGLVWMAGSHGSLNAGAIAVAAAWALFNAMVLAVVTGAAREGAQRRRSVRVAVAVPADVILADGTMVQGVTCDLSAGGMRARMGDVRARPGDAAAFILPLLDGSVTIRATVVSVDEGGLRARFGPLDLRQAEALTTLLYSRADAWLDWGEGPQDAEGPLRDVARMCALALRGLWRAAGGRPRRGTGEKPLAAHIAPLLLAALVGGSLHAAMAAQTGTMPVPRPAITTASKSAVRTASSIGNHAAGGSSAAATLGVARDLAILPRPFAGSAASEPVQLVFPSPPSRKAMQAAGIVASWLGVAEGEVGFAVTIGPPPPGNVIVFAENPAEADPELGAVAITGPTVMLRANPNDPAGVALVVAGNDADQLLAAATALALDSGTWQGTEVSVATLAKAAPRAPDDAPRWLVTDRAATFGRAQVDSAGGRLQGDGSHALTATLRLPPDIDLRGEQDGERRNIALHLDYRYNAVPLGDGSTLQVFVNGAYVSSTPMPHTERASEVLETVVPVPLAALRPFDNDFTFQFAFRAARSGKGDAPPTNLMGAVLNDSYLDISGMRHWTRLPDLALFARGGYPFTRRADLADTAVAMPRTPGAHEIEAFLALMARFGSQTGLPAVNVTVTDSSAIHAGSEKDLLVLGTPGDAAIAALDPALPVGFTATGLKLRGAEGIFGGMGQTLADRMARWRGGAPEQQRFGEVESAGLLPDATVEEMEWPRGSGRTAVVIALREDAAATAFTGALLGDDAAGGIAQSVTILRGRRWTSYQLGDDAYWAGALSPWERAEVLLEESPWPVAIVVAVVCFLFAGLLQARLGRRARDRLQIAA